MIVKHPYFDITGGNIDRGGKSNATEHPESIIDDYQQENARLKRENTKLMKALKEAEAGLEMAITRMGNKSKNGFKTSEELALKITKEALSQTE